MAKTYDPAFRAMRGQVTPVQDAAVAVALLFVVVGALGFLPGITTNYESLEFAGPGSDARLLGLFEVSVLGNVLHIGIGVVGAFMSWFLRGAVWFLRVAAAVLAVVGVYGLVVPDHSAANFLPTNVPADIAHLVVAAGMLVLLRTMPRHPTAHSTGGSILGPS